MRAWLIVALLALGLAPLVDAEPAAYAWVETTTFTSGSGTYTTPLGVDMLEAVCVGGGGGSGAVGLGLLGGRAVSGAGGGGGYGLLRIVAPASTYAYSVGVGGAGGASGGNGGNGASSSFGAMTCEGGLGGEGTASANQLALGGSGGSVGGATEWQVGGAGTEGLVVGTWMIPGVGGSTPFGPGATAPSAALQTDSCNSASFPHRGSGASGNCRESSGSAGQSSAAGNPGLVVVRAYVLTEPRTLVDRVSESPGANCDLGGEKVSWGQDDDRDGVLDAGEVEDLVYVCAPLPGPEGPEGPIGPMGVPGSTVGNLSVQLLHPVLRVSTGEVAIYAQAKESGVPTNATLNVTISHLVNGTWTEAVTAAMQSLGAGLYGYVWNATIFDAFNVYVRANTTLESMFATDVFRFTDFKGESLQITSTVDPFMPMLLWVVYTVLTFIVKSKWVRFLVSILGAAILLLPVSDWHFYVLAIGQGLVMVVTAAGVAGIKPGDI